VGSWKPVSDHIITARFQARYTKKSNIIHYYAPTDNAELEKDIYYEQLQDTINDIPRHDIKIMMEDRNMLVCWW